jgi:hypothetical protein
MKSYNKYEALFKALGKHEVQSLLLDILNEDYYLEHFTQDNTSFSILETFEFYNIVFVTEDDRVLLTQVGEKLLQNLSFWLS